MDSNSKGSAKFQILHGSVARRVLLRSLLIAAAMSVVPLVHVLTGPYLKMLAPICAVRLVQSSSNFTPTTKFVLAGRHLSPIWSSVELKKTQCEKYSNLTREVVRELTEKKLLNPIGARALCVGEGSAQAAKVLQDSGFPDSQYVAQQSQRFFRPRKLSHAINRGDGSFDFVLSAGLDTASSAPALAVLEIERVLGPGGVGAVLVGTATGSAPNSLIRSATPISSALKASSIVHVNRVGNLTLVVFKKRVDNVGYFEQYRLPADCPSVLNNRPFVPQMEPLASHGKNFSYLPNLVEFSSKKRLVYIDIGSGKHLNSNAADWFPPKYPIDQKAFSTYFVDHNTSVMLSYVRKPGITFVYHPGLSGTVADEAVDDDSEEPYMGNVGFDFLAWFKETSQNADFVVLKMNAGNVEMKFLSELFESGSICYVDELFLHCPGLVDNGGVGPVGCVDLLKDLRNSGVFVHQWWGDYEPTAGAW